MTAAIQIEGLEQLARNLLEFTPKLAKKGFRRAQRAAAKVFLPEVRRRAPVYEGPINPRTGRPVVGALRRSHKVKALPRSRSRFGVTVTSAADSREFPPIENGFYGSFVELGTKTIAPRHYILDSFEATQSQAQSTLGRELAAEVRSIAAEAKK